MAMDVIDNIYPTSSKRHNFILVATNYFTKWVEAEPLINVTQELMIRFIRHNMVYRFGIPELIMTDQGTMLNGGSEFIHTTIWYQTHTFNTLLCISKRTCQSY